MSFNPGASVTGAAITGLTSPTYTLTSDVAPAMNGKQFAVTALGGTQANVDVNSVSRPFTVTFFRPSVLRSLPAANPVTGVIKNISKNTYKLITRKGMAPAANQSGFPAVVTTTIEIPAGADVYEPEDIKAMLSCHFGAGFSNASGIADTVLTGVM